MTPIAGMPPHHRKKYSSNFITGIFTLPEDGQVMTETCRSFSKILNEALCFKLFYVNKYFNNIKQCK